MGKKIIHLLFFLLVTAACVGITLLVGGKQYDVMIYNFAFMGVMVVLSAVVPFSRILSIRKKSFL